MGKSCKLCAETRDSLGRAVKSVLHKNLLKLHDYCASFVRKDANTVYYMSKTHRFRDTYQEQCVLDENGEPRVISLWEKLKHTSPLGKISQDMMLEALRKEHGETYCTFEEGLNKVQEFNKANYGGDLFIGTLKYDYQAKKFRFCVVQNSIEEQREFAILLRNKELTDILTLKLLKYGVAIDRLTEGSATGIFNSKNPRQLEENIFALISVKDPNFDFSTISHETGHFIMEAMEGTPLADRLRKIAESPQGFDTIQQILGEDMEQFDANATDEILGQLIAKSLKKELTKWYQNKNASPILKLIDRIIEQCSKKIKAIWDLATFNQDRFLARTIADNMAKEFFGEHMESAIKIGEHGKILKSIPQMDSLVASLISRIQLIRNKTKATELSAAEESENIFLQTSEEGKSLSKLQKHMYAVKEDWNKGDIEGAQLLKDYVNYITSYALERLDKLQFGLQQLSQGIDVPIDMHYRREDWGKLAQGVIQVEDLRKDIEKVLRLLRDSTAFDNVVSNPEERIIILKNLENVHDQLLTMSGIGPKQESNPLYNLCGKIRNHLVIDFMSSLNGSDHFFIPQYLGWKGRQGSQNISIDDYFRDQYENINSWGKIQNLGEDWLYSMSSNNYIINQLCFKAVNDQKQKANLATQKYITRINELYKKFKSKFNVDQSIFLERDEEGKITGNYIQKLWNGKWENARTEQKKRIRDKFIEDNVGKDKKYKERKDAMRSHEYYKYLTSEIKKWDKENSSWDKDGNIGPKDIEKYHNPAYDRIEGTELESFLNEIMDCKKELDSLMQKGTMPVYRMPQYVAKTSQFMSNLLTRYNNSESIAKGLFKGLNRVEAINLVYHHSREAQLKFLQEQGQIEEIEENYNEEIYDGFYKEEAGKIRILRPHGTKKIQDTQNLNTDIFGTLAAHANMCCNISGMLNVVNLLRLTKDKIESSETSINKSADTISGAKNRVIQTLEKYLDAHVFNLRSYQIDTPMSDRKTLFKKYLLYKGLKTWAGMTTFFMLGGNSISILFNGITAELEQWQRAFANKEDQFNAADLVWAHVRLGYDLVSSIWNHENVLDTMYTRNTSMTSLLNKRLGLGMGYSDFRNLNYTQRVAGVAKILGGIKNFSMGAYSFQDMLIQNTALYATLHHTKVYRKNSNTGEIDTEHPIRLFQLYKEGKKGNMPDLHKIPRDIHDMFFVPTGNTPGENIEFTPTQEYIELYDNVCSQVLEPAADNDENQDPYIDGEAIGVVKDGFTTFNDMTRKSVVSPHGILYGYLYADYSSNELKIRYHKYDDSEIVNLNKFKTSEMGLSIPEGYYIKDKNAKKRQLAKNTVDITFDIQDNSDIVSASRLDSDSRTPIAVIKKFDSAGNIAGDALQFKIIRKTVKDKDNKTKEIIVRYQNLQTKEYVKELPKQYILLKNDEGYIEEQEYTEYNEEQERTVSQKVSRLLAKMNGPYAKEDQARLANAIVGSVALNMKKFFIGLMESGVGMTKYSFYDDDITEGTSITFAKMFIGALRQSWLLTKGLANLGTDFGRFEEKERLIDSIKMAAVLISNFIPLTNMGIPTNSSLYNVMRKEGLSESQIYNLKVGANQIMSVVMFNHMLKLLAPSVVPDLPEPPEAIEEIASPVWEPTMERSTNEYGQVIYVYDKKNLGLRSQVQSQLMESTGKKPTEREIDKAIDSMNNDLKKQFKKMYTRYNALHIDGLKITTYSELKDQYNRIKEKYDNQEFDEEYFKLNSDYARKMQMLGFMGGNSDALWSHMKRIIYLQNGKKINNQSDSWEDIDRDWKATLDEASKKLPEMGIFSSKEEWMEKLLEQDPLDPSTFHKSRESTSIIDALNSMVRNPYFSGNVLDNNFYESFIVGSVPDALIYLTSKAANSLQESGDVGNSIIEGFDTVTHLVVKGFTLNATDPEWAQHTVEDASENLIPNNGTSWWNGVIGANRECFRQGFMSLLRGDSFLGIMESMAYGRFATDDFREELRNQIDHRGLLEKNTGNEYITEEDELVFLDSKNKMVKVKMPGADMYSLDGDYSETPFSVKGMLYFTMFRARMEQVTKANIYSFMMDPRRNISEWKAMYSGLLPNEMTLSSLHRFSEILFPNWFDATICGGWGNSAAHSAYMDPFVRNADGSIQRHQIKGTKYYAPVVHDYFKLAYYTNGDFKGLPKYLVNIWKSTPYLRGTKTNIFGYKSAASFDAARFGVAGKYDNNIITSDLAPTSGNQAFGGRPILGKSKYQDNPGDIQGNEDIFGNVEGQNSEDTKETSKQDFWSKLFGVFTGSNYY